MECFVDAAVIFMIKKKHNDPLQVGRCHKPKDIYDKLILLRTHGITKKNIATIKQATE